MKGISQDHHGEQNSILFRRRWPWAEGSRDFADALREALGRVNPQEEVFICLGSPHNPGDALGPLVGSILAKRLPGRAVFGTLDDPLDDTNLEPRMAIILRDYPRSRIIAVDAATGPWSSLGQVTVRRGALWPGLGLGKFILPLGDFSITGVVRARDSLWGKVVQAVRGRPEYWALKLSRVIAEGIIKELKG